MFIPVGPRAPLEGSEQTTMSGCEHVRPPQPSSPPATARVHLPKAQAMAAPTRPPPDTTTSYTVSAEEPAHRRQAARESRPAASGALLHQRTHSKPVIEPVRAAIMTRACACALDSPSTRPGSTSGAESFNPVPLQSFLQTGSKMREEIKPIRKWLLTPGAEQTGHWKPIRG